MDDAADSFAETIRSLESGTSDPDPRTDVGTASLIERYPELNQVTVTPRLIPAQSGELPARLYTPASTPRGALVWAHGGSFVGGNLDMPESNWVALALAARGYTVLSVEYTKALFGAHFPVPSIDLLDAWNWAIDELGIDSKLMHIGGASAGANLAAGVAVRLRDGQGPRPTSAVLVYPLVHEVLPEASAELQKTLTLAPSEARFPQSLVNQIVANYLGPEQPRGDPYAFAGNAQLHGMAPIFILNSEYDEHRLSGEEFARQARDAGVHVHLALEPETLHGHLDRPHSPHAQRSIERIADWLATPLSAMSSKT
ncbi:alpha/beta hydrolase [Paramicrobacterium chengjingii]|uniref:Alpha/beta hydrolase n=1 Tax=Paramicrobacterium chengjingii TaxID=2769067 RepID=A0ABX6YJK1_9MICO|nr:alpha/beta hydrolase [Microbacterium chengjingii]QPZ38931.1 alpha/beta hydrolase [Microbacterium chengjingii]